MTGWAHDIVVCSFVQGGAYAVLVRRQLSGPKLESSASLAAIGEEVEDEQNGEFSENADLMNRTETGEQSSSAICHGNNHCRTVSL